MKLSENTILITGGSNGIGFELAKQLLTLGNTVIITGRNLSKLDEVKTKYPEIQIFQSDAAKPDDIKSLYDDVTREFPGLNVLINNAGIMRKMNLHDSSLDLENINQEIVINLSGPVRMVNQFLPYLKTKKHAAIVNISSGLAFVPFAISPVYSATKAGIHFYTQALRIQLKNTNVEVFELMPPLTNTKLQNAFSMEDLRGATPMEVDKMVKFAIRGFSTDTLEIRPGQSNLLRIMSRLAPHFILKQMSRPVDSLLEQPVNPVVLPAWAESSNRT
ncbi:MAG: SDR family NAD(P)-dependent oxidoreductase [Paludibacter sp.]|nr:SDR family NAD(P)-dependent oxidoreductase [Paludibacter sp.]